MSVPALNTDMIRPSLTNTHTHHEHDFCLYEDNKNRTIVLITFLKRCSTHTTVSYRKFSVFRRCVSRDHFCSFHLLDTIGCAGIMSALILHESYRQYSSAVTFIKLCGDINHEKYELRKYIYRKVNELILEK